MPRIATIRLAALATGLAALASVLSAPGVTSTATAGHDEVRVVSTTYPTNAAKIFRWGDAQWYDNFISPVKPMWSVDHPSLVRDQHGMLTINATGTSGTVSATLTGHGRRYGRWEARVRAEQYTSGHTPYHVVWELVPAAGYHCGARSIVLADYALGTSRANMYLRNLPNTEFRYGRSGLALGPGPFHTYAVEVTPTHISWFVDTHVLMTERRAAARTGATYAVRFRLAGTAGAQMNPGRMQMDWVRFYSLARPNARSIAAPQAQLGTYTDAC
jgi:beta-glucanase (GH16 family)